MTVKSENERLMLREGGRRLAEIMERLRGEVREGILALKLEELARELVEKAGGEPAFLGYTPSGAKRPYPAALCVSINDEIVHGIPNEEEKIIREGDIVKLDLGFKYKSLITDLATTVGVGKIDSSGAKLIEATGGALEEALKVARAGVKVGVLGEAVESHVKKYGFTPADELGGHGVGLKVHEDPFVPNSGPRGRGPELKENEVIAIEPIINEGDSGIALQKDGYTFVTVDGKRSAQFEHTVIVGLDGPEILTKV